MDLGKLLLIVGIVMALISVALTIFPNIPLPPRLPGDIYIKKDNFTFYFPIVSSILLSTLISIIAYLFFRR